MEEDGEKTGVRCGQTHSLKHQRGRTCRFRSKEFSEVSGKLESAEWIFPRSPKGTTPAESKGVGGEAEPRAGSRATSCPEPHCPVPGNASLSGGVSVPRGKRSRLSEVSYTLGSTGTESHWPGDVCWMAQPTGDVLGSSEYLPWATHRHSICCSVSSRGHIDNLRLRNCSSVLMMLNQAFTNGQNCNGTTRGTTSVRYGSCGNISAPSSESHRLQMKTEQS